MRAAFYEADITPPIGGYMWGYYRKRIAEGVAERLYAKALVVEDKGNIAAIVAIDACTLPPELHDAVTQRIYEYTGISPECVSISATHTHKGIPISDSPDIDCYADKTYTDVCYRLIADAVILAYKRLGTEDVEVRYGTGVVDGVAYSRIGELNDGTYHTHIRTEEDAKRVIGEVDKSLNIITFSVCGKKIGAVINYSCHLDCTTSSVMEYSGDYAAILSKILKQKYGNDFVSLFLTGTCGNVTHVCADENVPVDIYTEIGEKIATEAVRIIEKSEAANGGVSVCKELVCIERRMPDDNAFSKLFDKKTGNLLSEMWLLNYMYYSKTNVETHSNLYVQAIKIGDVAISILPGEIFAATGLGIKCKSPYKNTFVVENSNSYCGYIPTKDMFGENSLLYETMLCYHSCHIPEAADIIEKKALELLNNV